jgi:hypothetical protein
MGYKLWATNELLTSSDVNTYLMKQSVISTTSGSKPSSPPDGMVVWETDTERYVSYNATAAAWKIWGQMLDGSYTPSLTATTTNPTLGSGSGTIGRYTLRNGIWCDVRFTIKFGASGAAAGSGQYLISLPFTSASDFTIAAPDCGAGYLRDDSANATAQGMSFVSPGFATASFLANNVVVTSSAPWAWANLDSLAGSLTYRTAL